MSEADTFRRLFNYDHWSNSEVLSVLEEAEDFEYADKTTSLMSHLLAAQELWHRRIEGSDVSGFEVWPVYTMNKLHTMVEYCSGNWQKLIAEKEDNFSQIISYKNTSGTAYETQLSDILHHVIIHGQHHRAQVATRLREGGIKPPATDFIFYTRKN